MATGGREVGADWRICPAGFPAELSQDIRAHELDRVAYDNNSNVLYTVGGHYTLQGETCTESIEVATGAKAQFLGTHPTFRIRLDGDKFYEMGMGMASSIEQMWQRVGE